MLKKFITLIVVSVSLGFLSRGVGLSVHQATAVTIFSVSILGTLIFWNFRLSFAFLGTSVLLLSRTIDIEHLIRFSSLEIILFLVGMMVIIGLLKEEGLFAWLVSMILRIPHLTAKKFFFAISILSALLACAIDEVTSIIFMVAAIIEICDYFEIDPRPFIICSVMTTNIGSAGTVLGNPIGILIATKAGLSFEDFIIKAFPLMLLCLCAAVFVLLIWYQKAIRELDQQIKRFGANEILMRLISVPPERHLKISLVIFIFTLVFISLHHRLELALSLEKNTILLVAPLFSAGIIMLWKWRKAREFIEKDVEWWTLLFFMLLFAQAGTLKYTGASDILAQRLVAFAGNNLDVLKGIVVWLSAIGSSILDNVVLVASFIPVMQSFQSMHVNLQSLWWALLFGGCFGGNITFVGSTANIVALGILEKEKNIRMTFFQWFWIGLTVGIITTAIVWIVLLVVPWY
ncbi:MAG: SLC13 family permease [Candidatus Omnitrophota bacterium]